MANSEPHSPTALPRSLAGALFHPWTWKMAWRDSRTQRRRLILFSLAIVSGVAALVAIHSLKSSVETGIATQAKALLGSDLQISSRRPFAPADEAAIVQRARRVTRETSFSSMLAFTKTGAARLVYVRGLDGDYPYYGPIATTPPDVWKKLRSEHGLLLEPALLDQFNAKVGDTVKLGSLELPILGVVDKAPPRTSRFAGFSPEVYLRRDDLARTGLLGKTSLSTHLLHLELPPGTDRQKTKAEIAAAFPDAAWRLETPEERRETLGDSLNNFQQFLGIIALAALVLGAIGVAGAVHAHVSRRVPTIAILRCLGCPGNVAFGIYLAQALSLGLLGAGLGAALGVTLHTVVVILFRDSLPVAVEPAPHWRVVAEMTAAGFAVCCSFALLPLLRVRRISPAATLRDGAALSGRAGALAAWPVYLLLTGLLILLALLNASGWRRALALVGGLGLAFGLLTLVARGLVFAARRAVRPSWPYLLRQGVSNLHRPHNQTLLFLLSLGLGTFLLLTVLLTRNLLAQRLTLAQFAESPNVYLIDVQPDQLDGVLSLIRAQKLPLLETAPMVTMRIQSVKGSPVRLLEKKGKIPKWALQREFRSSYRDHLNSTEQLVSGQWFTGPADPNGPVPLSLEEDLAKDLRVAVGDEIVLDVQGVPITARVANLRKVDWSRFNLNFFMIFPPGVLESAPGFHVVTTRIPADRTSGQLQRAMAAQFPNVSAIDLTLILTTVRGILEKISRVITVLAGFTVLAGLPILIGALLNGRDQRLRESVLLRTLGASERQVRTILIIEYAALGVLSATTGIILSVAANYALARFVFEAAATPDPRLLAATFLLAAGLAIAGGLALSRGVCRHPPLEILRSSA